MALVAIATYLVTSFGAVASAAPGEPTTPAPNPDLTKACGLDVLVILDESGSIESSNATDDVRRAFTAFVDSLNNTGSSMAVVEFSTVARLPSIGGLPGGQYITITDGTSQDFEDYIEDDYNPNDKTNWEDALPRRPLHGAEAQCRDSPSGRVHHRRRPDCGDQKQPGDCDRIPDQGPALLERGQ